MMLKLCPNWLNARLTDEVVNTGCLTERLPANHSTYPFFKRNVLCPHELSAKAQIPDKW